jgi:TRAP-type mannitol/chloroaromatic compound transport system permease large subunit
MTAILFVFLPNLYSVIERLQCALAWFGVLIAMDL